MKKILFILICLIASLTGYSAITDTVPNVVPQLFGGKYYKFNGYMLADSLLMTSSADTPNVPVYFPAIKFRNANKRWYGYDLTSWTKFLIGADTVSLSNRINAVNPTLQQVINNGNVISEPDSIRASDGNTVTIFGGPGSTWQTKLVSTTSQTENRFTSDIIVTRMRNLNTGNFKGYSINSSANTGISVFDQQDLIGLSYENDYHVNGIAVRGNRWIPDYGAVKQAIHDSLSAFDVSPTLQDVMYNGNNTATTYLYDTTLSFVDLIPKGLNVFKARPLSRTGKFTDFNFTTAATPYSGTTTADKVFNMGWNMNPGAGPETAGLSGGGLSFENYYIQAPGDTINGEYHLMHIDEAGTQHRLFSWTIRENIGFYDAYLSAGRVAFKSIGDQSVYFNVQNESTGASMQLSLSETKSLSLIYDTTGTCYLNQTGLIGTPEFRFGGWSKVTLPTLAVGNVIEVSDGAHVYPVTSNTTELGNSAHRWSLVGSVDGNFSGDVRAARFLTPGLSPTFASEVAGFGVSQNAASFTAVENGGTGAASQAATGLVEDNNHYYVISRYNNSWSGNFTGTSIPQANAVHLYNVRAGNVATDPIFINGGSIIGAPGVLSTDYGFKQDVNGFRIDQLQNLHTTNISVPFHIAGFSTTGSQARIGNFSVQSYNADISVITTNVDGTGNHYLSNGFGSRLDMATGTLTYYKAPSGTAGGTVTFTEGFKIDVDGKAYLASAQDSGAAIGGYLWRNPADGKIKLGSGGDGNGIYSGSGSLSGNNTVTFGSNNLTFDATSSGKFKLNVGSDATGDTYYRNGSGNVARLAIGTSGYVNTSSGSAPQWTNPATITTLPMLSVVAADPTDWLLDVSTFTSLPDLAGAGGSKVLTMPSAASNPGKFVYVWNKNASIANTWSFAAAWTDPTGATSSLSVNGTMVIFISDGSVWLRVSVN